MPPPFVKIIQSFFLMVNIKKKDLIEGCENFGALFGQCWMLPKFSRLGCAVGCVCEKWPFWSTLDPALICRLGCAVGCV